MTTAHTDHAQHTEHNFDLELQQLHDHLDRMGKQVRDMLADSLRALALRDTTLARRTIESDHIVNSWEISTDNLCLQLLARWQPVASDLRFIASTLKLVTDLERIGDLCVNVCERVLELSDAPDGETAPQLLAMGEGVGSMIETAMRAFLKGDVSSADRVLQSDKQIDLAYAQLFAALVDRVRHDHTSIPEVIRLQAVAKYLERMGDHATNLAEMVFLSVEGTDVRHPGRLPDRRIDASEI